MTIKAIMREIPNRETKMSGDHEAAQAVADTNVVRTDPEAVAAQEKRLRDLFRRHDLDAPAYIRLLIATALTRPGGMGVLGRSEVDMAKPLAARLGLTKAQARTGLRILRKSGCLRGTNGEVLLSHAIPIAGCVDRDPLRLDELCVRAYSRIADLHAQDVFDPGAARSAFVRLVGRAPIETDAEPLALMEVAQNSRAGRIKPKPIVAVINTLRELGLDPVPGVRREIISTVVATVAAEPGLTAGDLTARAGNGHPDGSSASIMRLLLRGKALLSADGTPASLMDDPIGEVVGTSDELEYVCFETCRAALERREPQLMEEPAALEALKAVFRREPPLTKARILTALTQAGIHPEPHARTSVMRTLATLSGEGFAGNREETVTAICERLPVAPASVRNIFALLTDAGELRLASDGQRATPVLTHANIGEAERHIERYCAAKLEELIPGVKVRAGTLNLFRDALGFSTFVKKRPGATNGMYPLYHPAERAALIADVREIVASVDGDGINRGDLRRALMALGRYSANPVDDYILTLNISNVFRTEPNAEGKRIIVGFAIDDPDEAIVALVNAWFARMERKCMAVTDETRARFWPPGAAD